MATVHDERNAAMRPTIILVHGAFAESASWKGVLDPLLDAGHRVVAAPNPLRGVTADAAAVGDLVRTIDGPVVLVGHSYGGAVITNVDADAGEIAGLVYVAGFAPEPGESARSALEARTVIARDARSHGRAAPALGHDRGLEAPAASGYSTLSPAADSAYHPAPKSSSSWPLVWPGAVSPSNV
jgi:pimeloyl-ACP methyl ester carboxylesterase